MALDEGLRDLVAYLRTTPMTGHRAHQQGSEVVWALTDSQSVVRALAAGPWATTDPRLASCWRSLRDLWVEFGLQCYVQWVPGHAGLAGNEQADGLAAEGAQLP